MLNAQGIALVVFSGLIIQCQIQPFARGIQGLRGNHLVTEAAQVKIVQFEFGMTTVQFGGVQYIVEQVKQRPGRGFHHAKMPCLGFIQRCVQYQVCEADNGVHRGADFMAHVGQKRTFGGGSLLSFLFRPAQIGFHSMAFGNVSDEAYESADATQPGFPNA